MSSYEIVCTNVKIYKPVYDEETGLYSECPYKNILIYTHVRVF